MILNGPTGLWSRRLPKGVEAGTVTYTISNNDPPPPSNKIVPKMPASVAARSLPALSNRELSDPDKRNLFGERILSTVDGGVAFLRSGAKLFEAGEAIETTEDLEAVDPRALPYSVRVRHNTNLLDLKKQGLTDDEIEDLLTSAEQERELIREEIAATKAEVEELRVSIADTQRNINETKKALRAVGLVKDIPDGTTVSGDSTYDKLQTRLVSLQDDLKVLVAQLNTSNAEAADARSRLLKLSEVVR